MNPLALLIIVGGGLALAAGGKRQEQVTAWFATPTVGAGPTPPTQGNGFRMGPQPDPAAPNDSNRGRTFVVMTQSRQSGTEAVGSFKLLNLPMTANGSIEVIVWATRAGHPNRCSRWSSKVSVKDGRMVNPPAMLPAMCGSEGHATVTDSGGCSLNMPSLAWEQQGPMVAMLWKTSVREGSIWSDKDCDEDLDFYVDAFWRYTPA